MREQNLNWEQAIGLALRAPRILSICSGIGGLDLGIGLATRHAARTICYVERDAFCASILAARMGTGLDSAPIWDDVKSFDGKPWRGVVDCIIGGYPCFRGDMRVLTEDGYQAISSISIGTRVLTHQGRWRRVTAIMHKSDSPLRRIRAQGTTEIITTDEHPFYARRQIGREWDKEKSTSQRAWSGPKWVAAADMQAGTFIGQVLPSTTRQAGNTDFWWLVGRYLADGWRFARPARKRKDGTYNKPSGGRVIICCGRHESDMLAERIARAGFNAYQDRVRTGSKFHITSNAFYKFLEQFGRYAHGKVIPKIALELEHELSRALCDGYASGDGWLGPNGDIYITTVSESLALGISLLAMRAYGVIGSIRKYKSNRVCVIEGRTVRERPQYRIHIPNRNRSGFIENDYGWKRLRVNEPCGRGDVYNIAVEEDESYCVNGAIVHNCQPFSSAGRRRGTDDPRHLWPFICRLIKTIKPVFCFFENVPGHLSLGFEQVCEDLQKLGYNTEAGIFSAEECGAPHQRQRLFFLSYVKRLPYGSEQHGKGKDVKQQEAQPCGHGSNGNVADAECSTERPHADRVAEDGGKVRRTGRQQATSVVGGSANVADASSSRCTKRLCRTCDAGERQSGLSQSKRFSASVANPDSRTGHSGCQCEKSSTVGGLGRIIDGPASWVDQQSWGHGWESDVPRVAIGDQLRIDRLRALGNAVVPATAKLAYATLAQKITQS